MIAPSQRPIDYSHYLPWTRLLRSFRIATDPRKLVLAAGAILLLWCGDLCFSYLPFAPADPPGSNAPWNAVEPTLLVRRDGAVALYDAPRERFISLAGRVLAPLRPLLDVTALPFAAERPWTDVAFLWTRLLWAFAVWSICGGAIARIAAVEFARDERIGLWTALKFALRNFLSFFSAPLLPLVGVLGIWSLCALGGLVGRIPAAGDWIISLGWGFALAASLCLLLVTIALSAAWPLMIAGVATEGSDAFDGFSRSFSYLYGRPWLYLFYVGLALLLGPLLVAAIDTLAVEVVAAAARTVGTGMGGPAVARLHSLPPTYFASAVDLSPLNAAEAEVVTVAAETPAAAPEPSMLPVRLTSVWLNGFATLAIGFASSFFWTAATIIYFLLRRADDATHFDEVWLGEQDEEDDLLPLVGIASTGQPVVERSHHPTVGPPAEVNTTN